MDCYSIVLEMVMPQKIRKKKSPETYSIIPTMSLPGGLGLFGKQIDQQNRP